MSDMPEWRAWADREHAASLRHGPKPKPLYRCTQCRNRATRNQAKRNDWMCTHCKAPLRARAQMVGAEPTP